MTLFVTSTALTIYVVVSLNDLFVNTSVVTRPISVSVIVGRLNRPVFDICAIIGVINVLPDNVCVADNDANVSVASGNVIILLVVWLKFNVKLELVVAPDILNDTFLLASILPTINEDASLNDLFVKISVVARPINVSDDVGSVNVPVFDIWEMTGKVNVLFVNTSLVVLPINVSVIVGNDNVPVFII